MADQKPPRHTADERQTLHALLQYQRESVVRKVTGVSDEAARTTAVPSGTTLLWLVKHLTVAEARWVLHRFADRDPDPADDSVSATDSVSAAVAAYREMWARVDAVVDATASLDEVCRNTGDESPVNLRWVLMHLLEETARHAGHADVLRELIDGQTGR